MSAQANPPQPNSPEQNQPDVNRLLIILAKDGIVVEKMGAEVGGSQIGIQSKRADDELLGSSEQMANCLAAVTRAQMANCLAAATRKCKPQASRRRIIWQQRPGNAYATGVS
jgi:hypothetical protein